MNIKRIIRIISPVTAAVIIFLCALIALDDYKEPIYDSLIPEKILANSIEEEEDKENDEEEVAVTGNYNLADGDYVGTGVGYKGDVKVSVSIKDRKIDTVNVLSNCDDTVFFNRACGVIDEIVAEQKWDVDVISGATYSSNGIKMAVRNALTGEVDSREAVGKKNNKKKETTTNEESSNNCEYKDGTYRGSGDGFNGKITVDVVIKKGLINKITIVSSSDGKDYLKKADSVIKSIIAKQSTNVDVASGATYSSNGIIDAVRDALKKAEVKKKSDNTKDDSDDDSENSDKKDEADENDSEDNSGRFPYLDGTYNGIGEGFEGTITVALTIKNKSIEAIEVVESMDDEPFFSNAKSILSKIVETQDINVDTVSGATYSSRGILEAVSNAIKSADEATNGGDNSEPSDSEPSNPEPSSDSEPSNPEPSSDSEPSNPEPSNPEPSNPEPSPSDDTPSGSDDQGNEVSARVYLNGTYTASAVCMPDEYWDFDPYNITVSLTIAEDHITEINSVYADYLDMANDAYFNWAINGRKNLTGVPARILELEDLSTISSVDVVSNATCSSKGIIAACEAALELAKVQK